MSEGKKADINKPIKIIKQYFLYTKIWITKEIIQILLHSPLHKLDFTVCEEISPPN